jgi:uncharacterized protein with FMN-binding domain
VRRAPIVLTVTVLGTAGVLLFKPLSPDTIAATGSTDEAPAPATTTGPASSSSAATSGAASSAAATPSATASSATPSASRSPKAKPSTSSEATSGSASGSKRSGLKSSGSKSSGSKSSGSSSSGSKQGGSSGARSGTFTGSPETTRFGTTQVRVTISGGRITEVVPTQLNQNDPRSYQISQEAVPTLRSEVLSAQRAAVDVVSGATYTSAAYEASLQSALDRAGYAAPDGSKASTDLSRFQ